MDQFESEVESIHSSTKKKKLDRDVRVVQCTLARHWKRCYSCLCVRSIVRSLCVFHCGFCFLSVQRQDRVEELQRWIDRHQFHVGKLEVCVCVRGEMVV